MLRRCLQLEPGFTPAYIELARLKGAKDPSVGALLKRVVQLNSNDPYYITMYAHWLLNHGKYVSSFHHRSRTESLGYSLKF